MTTQAKETMCIYIHTYTQKRTKQKQNRIDRKNIVIYDLDKYDILVELASKENTNVSSIMNNLYEDFITKLDSPQKTLELFEQEKQIPSLNDSPEKWKAFYKSLSVEEYKKLDRAINTIMFIHDKEYKRF